MLLFQSSGGKTDSCSQTGDVEFVQLVISYTQLACLTMQFINNVKLVQVQAAFFFSVYITPYTAGQIRELPVAPTRPSWESQ